MRWQQLFDDLEAQYEAAQAAELAAEVSDRTRRETALLRIVDRLRPSIGHPIVVRLAGAGVIEGCPTALGADWLLLAEMAGREVLVALPAVLSVAGLAAQSAPPEARSTVSARPTLRLTLSYALRGIARDRSAITACYIDGSTSSGTVDRVGADFVEIAEHPPGEARRRDLVRAIRTVPFTAIATVRRG